MNREQGVGYALLMSGGVESCGTWSISKV